MANLIYKKIEKDLPDPEYKTEGSIGFDLVARVETVVPSFEVRLIPLNLVVKIPEGYGLFLLPRSSTPIKKQLLIPNGVGIIDQDYCGEEDELKLQVLNFSKKEVLIERGERIAQCVIVKIDQSQLLGVEKMSEKSRGGFGSTG